MSRPANRFEHIAFVASQTPEAREAYARLEKRYGNSDPAKADVIVALGGDGLMLQTLHKFMKSGKPIYGMHRGTVGFLMNEFVEEGLVNDWRPRISPSSIPCSCKPATRKGAFTNIALSTRCRCSGKARRQRTCAS